MDYTWSRLPYFVDKSLLIKAFLKSRHKAILVTAPQGFLKTTNIRMIASFISVTTHDSKNKDTRKTLFQNLNIMQCHRLVNDHLGQHPVVYFTFNQRQSYNVRFMVDEFRQLYSQYKFLLNSFKLTPADKHLFEIYLNYDSKDLGISEYKLADALKIMCELLHKHYDKQVYVFIDNYDSPVLEAIAKNRPMFNFQPFVERMISGVCGSKSVRTVLLTGITSVEKIRNAEFVTYRFLHNHAFSKYFGFTENDLQKVANKCSAEVLHEMLSRNYNTIINSKIYSPEWILHYLNYSPIEDEVWYENIFTKSVFQESSIRTKIRSLFDGKEVKFTVCKYESHKDVLLLNRLLNGTLEDILEEPEIDLLFSCLFEFGMLTLVEGSCSTLFSCWEPNPKMKFVLNITSRIYKIIRNTL